MAVIKSMTMRRLVPIVLAILCAALFSGAARAEDPAQTDTIFLTDGTSVKDYVVTDENWREVQAYRPSDGQTVTLPETTVERVEFNSPPLLYSVGLAALKQSRWQTAADSFAQALADETAKPRPWVKQYALYNIAQCRRILAELAGDPAAFDKAVEAYSTLLKEVPETKFKHDALLAIARCAEEQAALAANPDDKTAAIKRAEEAYGNFEQTCKKDFADAAFAGTLALRDGQAQIGALLLKYLSAASAEDFTKLAGEFRALAAEAGAPQEIALEANLRAALCDLAAATRSSIEPRAAGDESHAADGPASVKEVEDAIGKIAASGISEAAQQAMLVEAYSALGDHYFTLAQAQQQDHPERRELDSMAALAYLRIVLMYPAAPGAEALCQHAFYRAVLIMQEMGEVYLAKNLHAEMGQRFAESDFWKNTASKMLTQ
jgi:hypothetical protein